MNVLEKIKNLFKGIGIFFIIYTVISGNGDDTFFAWVLMFVSLILTILFLDETKNKSVLTCITLALAAICFRGIGKALPWLLLIFILALLYFVLGCKGDIREFEKTITLFLSKDKRNVHINKRNVHITTGPQWSAINTLNPFERYYYYSDSRELVIKKGIWPFRKGNNYSITQMVDTITREWNEELFFWRSIKIPLKYNANSSNPSHIVLKHVRKSKIVELDYIINGKKPKVK